MAEHKAFPLIIGVLLTWLVSQEAGFHTALAVACLIAWFELVILDLGRKEKEMRAMLERWDATLDAGLARMQADAAAKVENT